MTVHYVYYCLRKVHTTSTLSHQSVFNRISTLTAEKAKLQKKKTTKVTHLVAASVNMISRGRDLFRSQKQRRETFTPPVCSPISDYNPSLSQVLVNQEGAFQGTRSRVAIPYDYGQYSSSTRAVSPTLLRSLFQWLDDEEEASRYASSVTISSVWTGLVC